MHFLFRGSAILLLSLSIALVASLGFFTAKSASAGLVGSSMTIEETRISLATPSVFDSTFIPVVPNDGSVIWNQALFDVSVTGDETLNLFFTKVGNPDFGLIFSDLSWTPIPGTITAVDVIPSVDFDPSTSIEWSFTGDSVSVFFGDQSATDSIEAGSSVDIILTVMLVPEPDAAMLMIGTLLLIAPNSTRRS